MTHSEVASPTPAGQIETQVAATIAARDAATAAVEQAVKLTLTASDPKATVTPSPTATRVPVVLPTAVPIPTTASLPFTGNWQGIDLYDGSVSTLSLIQVDTKLNGAYKDSFSGKIPPPGYEGTVSGATLSATTARITFNLSRWDGQTVQGDCFLTLSNQNNTLTMSDCLWVQNGVSSRDDQPTIMRRL